jgi:hypothetical protein
MTIDEVNELCAEVAAENAEQIVNDYADELDMEMLLADPRFFGPDYGSDDCGGLFYWELK